MKRRNPSLFLFVFGLSILLTLASCNLNRQTPVDIPSTEALFTQAAETIIAGLTQAAPLETATQQPVATTEAATAVPEETLIPTETPLPTPTETPQPSPTALLTTTPLTGTVVFEEDFSSGRGWHTEENERFGFQFVDEAYRMYVNIANATIWSIREMEYADVILEVDAVRTGGPDSGYYGLVCRQVDEENFYVLAVASNGFYGIGKNENGEFEFLEEGTSPEGGIQTGEAVNRIQASCVGDTLALFANGQKLAEIQEDDFPSGDIGLAAGTQAEEGLEVTFDNLTVIEP